jgi:hypothetical protein
MDSRARGGSSDISVAIISPFLVPLGLFIIQKLYFRYHSLTSQLSTSSPTHRTLPRTPPSSTRVVLSSPPTEPSMPPPLAFSTGRASKAAALPPLQPPQLAPLHHACLHKSAPPGTTTGAAHPSPAAEPPWELCPRLSSSNSSAPGHRITWPVVEPPWKVHPARRRAATPVSGQHALDSP